MQCAATPSNRGFETWIGARCSPAEYGAVRAWRKAARSAKGAAPPLPNLRPYIDDAEFLGRGALPTFDFIRGAPP